MHCHKCGFEIESIEDEGFINIQVETQNSTENISSQKMKKNLCTDCAITIQHEIFHMIYDLD